MEWLTQLQGQVVGLDTAPLIYFIEQNDTYLELVRAFFKAMNQGQFQVVTSTLTLTEVLVGKINWIFAQCGRLYLWVAVRCERTLLRDRVDTFEYYGLGAVTNS